MKIFESKSSAESGFSLVEVVIALAIAAVALVSLIGFLPQALRGQSDGANQTAIGLMLEDVHDRMEGSELKEGVVPLSPLFYDQRGVYHDPNREASPRDSIITEKFYRVEVEIVKPKSSADDSFLSSAFAVKIDIFWPVEPNGEALDPVNPGSSITYFTAAKTGPGWQVIDSEYTPKIEY